MGQCSKCGPWKFVACLDCHGMAHYRVDLVWHGPGRPHWWKRGRGVYRVSFESTGSDRLDADRAVRDALETWGRQVEVTSVCRTGILD